MLILAIVILFVLLCIISCCFSEKSLSDIKISPIPVLTSLKNKNTVRLLDNKTNQYLSLKYAGSDKKTIYNPILLPYKNKQNKFILHKNDYLYIQELLDENNINTSPNMSEDILFITSDYNDNKGQYFELIPFNSNYILKASIWYDKGPYSFIHIDDNNKLYFDSGIFDNVAIFSFES